MSLEGTSVCVADSIRISLSVLLRVFKLIVLFLWVVQLSLEITENLVI